MKKGLEVKEYDLLVRVVQEVAGTAQSLFAADSKWEGRDTGYFCLADAKHGRALYAPTPIGTPGKMSPESVAKRIFVVQEKPGRAARHPEHVSSWESRNENALPWGEWGGSALISGFRPSLTGYPELGDEAIILVAMIIWSDRDPSVIAEAEEIAWRSSNPYFTMLLLEFMGGETQLIGWAGAHNIAPGPSSF